MTNAGVTERHTCQPQKLNSGGSNPPSRTNVPLPESLDIGSTVNYHRRAYTVITQQGSMYMIKDNKNGRIRWGRPEHVEIAALV
jgi:hypothetical protein